MKTILIIPAFNEEENLPELLNEIRHEGYNAVIVNDASTDKTGEVAAASGFPVITLPINLGIGGAVQTGFIFAMRKGYDIAVQIDGDGQHNPKWVNKVIKHISLHEADCVIGSRFMPEVPDHEYKTSFVRRVGIRFSSIILKISTGLNIYDTTSGFRALNREAFSYFSSEYPVDHPEAEALFLLHREGFRITEVPITMRHRMRGESLFGFIKIALYPIRIVIGFMGLLFKKPRRRQ